MVAKGERKIWSRSQSFSSRSKKSGGEDDDETTVSSKTSASIFNQKMRYETPAANASSASSVSTSQQRTGPDDASMNDDESRKDVDDDRYSTNAADDVESVKLSRTQSSKSNASNFLAGIKDRKKKNKNKKKLDPRPLDDNVRFISPGSDDVRIYSMDSKASKVTAASSKTDGDEDDDSEPSFEEDSRYDDDSLGFSKSYDSLWGDEVDRQVLTACNPIPVGIEKTWKSTKKSIQKRIPRVKADLKVELPQNLASLKASACVEMPGVIPSNLKSPTEEDIKRMKEGSIKSFNFAKDKATEWANYLYKTCNSEEDEEEDEEEINDIIEEDKDLILDMKLAAGGGDKIVDEFRRTFSESRFQAHKGASTDAGAPPPILSAEGQVIHQYIVDVASLGKGQSPAQKWSRLSETLLRDPSQAALRDKTGRTPLSYCCEYGNDIPYSVLRAIVECNPDATCIADNEGKTPLHYYVSSNDGAKKYSRRAKVVKVLAKYYYKVTTMQDEYGNTPLLSAIEAYAAVNEKTEADLRLPLINAVLDVNKDAVAIPNKQQSYPLHFAAKGHHDHLIESLLFHCPSAVKKKNCFGVTPIFLAVYWRAPFDSLKMLLAADPEGATVRSESIGDDPISLVYHSLIYPSSEDDFERVKNQRVLMNKANSLKKLPVDIRVEWVMLELLAKAAYHKSSFLDLPDATWRPLHALCALDVPPELVRFACRFHRGDLYDKDEEGRLPIHICASSPTYVKNPSKREAKHSLMRYLLHEDSAVAKIFDKSGRLPIHFACKNGKTWSKGGLKHLVEAYPSSLRISDGVSGMLPFMLAATHNPSEVSNRRERAERKAANAFPNHDFYAFPDDDKNDIVQAIYGKEEVEQLETVYHLIRSDPGSLISDLTAAHATPKKARRSNKMDDDQVEISLEAFSIVRDAISEDQEPEAKPAYGYECYSDDEASNDTNGDDESALRSYLEDHSETFSRSTATRSTAAYSNTSTMDFSEQRSDYSEGEDETSFATNNRPRAVKHTNKGLKKKNQPPRSVLKKPTDWNDAQSVRTSTTRVSFAPGADVVSVMGNTHAGSITSRYRHDKYLASSSKRLQAIYSRQAMPGQKLEVRKGVRSNKSKKSKQIRTSPPKDNSSKKSDASVPSLPSVREKSHSDNVSVKSSRTSSKPPTAPKTPRRLSEAKPISKKSPKAADDDVSEAPSRASRSRKTLISSNSSVISTASKVPPRKMRPVKLKKRLDEESDAESVKSRITL